MEFKGIDVSRYQGAIDFKKVKASGISFVMLRCGSAYNHTACKDKCFETFYKQAKEAGLNVGVYFFSYATTVAQAKEEAKWCLDMIKGKTFEYPIACDMEADCTAKTGKTNCSAMCDAFCSELEKNGYFAMLYSNKYWLTSLFNADVYKKYAIWIAQYNNKVTWDGKYTIWQYTSKASIPGVKGNCDANICTVDYPSIIKKAGLNGFKKPTTTTVTTNPKTENKPTSVANTYTVKKGDTLSGIASKNKTTVANLVKLNRLKYPSLILNKNLIKVGWVLKVK